MKYGITNAKGSGGGGGKSTFFTTTIPTFDNVNYVYVLAKTNVDNETGATFNTGDLVEYINSNGKLDAVFTITAVGSTDLTLSFIASIPPYENGCWILDTTNLTLDSGNYYIAELSDIDNRNDKEIKVEDVLIGTDGNIYTLYAINGNEIVVVLAVAGSGGGKQLYQHNFALRGERYAGGDYHYIWSGVSFVSDDNTPITSYPLLKAYLINKGYTSSNNMLMSVNGISKNTGVNINLWVVGIFYNQTEDRLYCKRTDYNNTQTDWWKVNDISESDMNDDPKPL